jgi:hypothetical protein
MSDDRWMGLREELSGMVREARQRLSQMQGRYLEAIARQDDFAVNLRKQISDDRKHISEFRQAITASPHFGKHRTLPYYLDLARLACLTMADHHASAADRLLRPVPGGPPSGACFLLNLLLAKADRDAIPGDLEEEFTNSILPKYGARRARFWFWTQTVRTIATRNPICRWSLVGGLVRIGEWIFRQIGG